MIIPRQLTPLCLALVLGAAPLLAQPAPQATGTQGKAPDNSAPAQAAPAGKSPAGAAPQAPQRAQQGAAADKGKDSPFDYRSSEEISEDVPVSFPVDI